MRTEVKIGVILGLLVVTVGVFFFFTQSKKEGTGNTVVPGDTPARQVSETRTPGIRTPATPTGGVTNPPNRATPATPVSPPAVRQPQPPRSGAAPGLPGAATPAGGAERPAGTPATPTGAPGGASLLTAPPATGGGETVAPVPPRGDTESAARTPTTMPVLPPTRTDASRTGASETGAPRNVEDTLLTPRGGPPPATPVTPPETAAPRSEAGGVRPSPDETVLTPRGNATPGVTPPTPRGSEPPGALPRGGTPPTNAKRHTVAEGDSLWSIAQSYYGDGNQWPKLKAANPGLDETSLKVGQVVVVPQDAPVSPAGADASRTRGAPDARTDAAPATPTGGAAAAPGGAGGKAYVVEEGDSLASIARNLLGSSERWREIYELNKSKIANPNVLLVGTELKLPEGATAAKPTTERGTTERRAAPRQGRSTTPPAARPTGGSRTTPPAAQPTTPPTRSGTRSGDSTTPRRTSTDRKGTDGAALRPVTRS